MGGKLPRLSLRAKGRSMPLPSKKKFPWAIYWIVLFLLLTVMLAPVGSVVVAGSVANAYGCQVDEGSVHPCVIAGQDRGELLYTLGVLGWFMLLTLPAGALAFVIWFIVLILHRAVWRKRSANESV